MGRTGRQLLGFGKTAVARKASASATAGMMRLAPAIGPEKIQIMVVEGRERL